MLQTYNIANESIHIFVGDRLYPRDEAKVSVFDSSVQGGDAVWEGLRVYNGRIFSLEKHLERMELSAHSLDFKQVPTKEFIQNAIFKTLEANGMRDHTHIRLTLTRGEKITSGMDPRLNTKGCTLIVLAEWKPPVFPPHIKMVTTAIRRNSPLFLDSKIHHNNLLNNILAKIEANYAGADEGLMLDQHGFVSEANSVNVFMVRKGEVLTPFADNCLPGITRAHVFDLCKDLQIPCREKNLSVTEFYTADEVFCTGTMGELTGVTEIDGRTIFNRSKLPILEKLQIAFRKKTETEGTPLPF
jgi:branched-chain amino acid aminotransferase